MLITCWSVKGGSGTTVVAASLALLAARSPEGSLLVDAAGDQPAALGLPEPAGQGVGHWLESDLSVAPQQLAHLEVEVRPGLHLLPKGGSWLGADRPRACRLAAHLAADARTVVVDSALGSPAELALLEAAHRSLLVLRPCYLALRRAVATPLRPTGVVLVASHAEHCGEPTWRRSSAFRSWPRSSSIPRWREWWTPACSAPACRARWSTGSAAPHDAGAAGARASSDRAGRARTARGRSRGGVDRRDLPGRALVRVRAPLLPPAHHQAVVQAIVARTTGLGPLQPLLGDPLVQEVLVNGGHEVWVERSGRLERCASLLPGEAERLLERILAPLGLRADRTSPVVDARLPDGSRVHAVVPPVAVDGTCLAIRRFAGSPIPLASFADEPVVRLLEWMVAAGWNVLVSGATSSGKTTLLNALTALLPPDLRIVTIEDAAELRIPGEHVVRLEARPPTAEGLGGVDIRALVRAALRLRPDRLVVGEVRGPEALDLLTALNTGHDGSLSTCHANSAVDALHRIEALALQADGALPLDAMRLHVQSALDAVVHVARVPGGARRVHEVAEVRVITDGSLPEPRLCRLASAAGLCAAPSRAARALGAPAPWSV